MLNKILEELNNLESGFQNRKLYHKLFMPVFILVIRIECEAIFLKKFKCFFSDEKNLKLAMEKINELITTIFDPNCYFNTFSFLSTDNSKHINNKLFPKYKTKVNATSNLINQLFTTFKNEQNVKIQMKGIEIRPDEEKVSLSEWEEEKNYIMNSKIEFYRVLLNRINQNLKKRNLDPIFKLGNKL